MRILPSPGLLCSRRFTLYLHIKASILERFEMSFAQQVQVSICASGAVKERNVSNAATETFIMLLAIINQRNTRDLLRFMSPRAHGSHVEAVLIAST